MTERVVALIDMDCFYCQVESRENPELRGKPSAVVQYRDWKGGGIIAVNYEARAAGVTRQMRGDDAKQKCPEIILVRVPEVRGKADLTKYRSAGKEVIQVLLEFGAVVERASVDEAYVDLTNLVEEKLNQNHTVENLFSKLPNTFVVGHDEREEVRESGLRRWLKTVFEEEPGSRLDDMRLAIGAVIVEEMRERVYEKTQFRCSAGIAHNKTISKFACGIHKPNKQSILPPNQIQTLFRSLKVSKLRGLGGKLGDSVEEDLNCKTLSDLAQLSMKEIRAHYDEKTSSWLYNISRGICLEPVKERDLPKSIGCSKNFRGPEMLETREKVEFWIRSLCEEVSERLVKDREDNNRQARGLHVSITAEGKGTVSRAGPLHSYDVEKLARQSLSLISKANEAAQSGDKVSWRPKLKNISVSASKFDELAPSHSITNFFVKKSGETNTMEQTQNKITTDSQQKKEEVKISKVAESSPTTSNGIVAFFHKKVQEDVTISDASLKIRETPDSKSVASSNSGTILQNQDSEDSVTVDELVPDLESFDPSLLEILPPNLKKLVAQKVENLKKLKKCSRLFSGLQQVESEKPKNKIVFNDSASSTDDSVATEDENRKENSLYSEELLDATAIPDDEMATCEKCGDKISPFELPEHLDFHVAQDLQREMRSNAAAGVRTVVINDKTKLAPKRKTKAEVVNQPVNKKQKNILSFFAKKD